ncbi:MAG: Spy/CpxP family protein refolding chaperone [Nitrospirae bacterium]|nr:Spy/CpxP family protein refolding chaperone [Nitrospirota bacterium]
MIGRWTFAVTAVVMAAGLLLAGGCRKPDPEKRVQWMLDQAQEELNLSAAQRSNLDGIAKEIMGQVRDMHEDRAAIHDEVKAQLKSNAVDAARIKEVVSRHRGKMDEVIDLGITRLVEFQATLTPQQRERLSAMIDEFDNDHCFMGGGPHGRCDGKYGKKCRSEN